MTFVKAEELGFDPRPEMGLIFSEAFYQWLKYFSPDRERLGRAFAHIFNLGSFFAAVEDGEIAAIAACTDGKTPPVRLDRKILWKHLGFVRGAFAYLTLKKHLVEHSYPFALPPGTGSVEFVAAAPKFRGKGAAYGLISHIMDAMPYSAYVLEVADTNTAAVRLYEKLGFTEITRTKGPDSKKSGVNFLVYMRKERP